MRPPVVGVTTYRFDRGSGRKAEIGQHHDYCAALAAAGAAPFLIPLGLDEEALRSLYVLMDGLLLPGGVDVAPERYGHARAPSLGDVDEELDRTELTVARWALEDGLPILAICRGIQLLNVAAGGTLCQDIPSLVPGAIPHAVADNAAGHTVTLEPGSRVSAALGGGSSCFTNSHHHQAVRDPAPGMLVTARAPDGVVEGIEGNGSAFVLGVQWHPESLVATRPDMLGPFMALDVAAEHDKRARGRTVAS